MDNNLWNPFRARPLAPASSYGARPAWPHVGFPQMQYNAAGTRDATVWSNLRPGANIHAPRPPYGFPAQTWVPQAPRFGPPPVQSASNGFRGEHSRITRPFRGQRFRGDHYRGGQHQHGFNAVNRHPRKQAVSVYCESCDKDFKNQDKLNEHLEKHIKCPKCEFVGIFETIEEHFEEVHLSALMNRMKPVETEDDLKKWRQDRSVNYPRVRSGRPSKGDNKRDSLAPTDNGNLPPQPFGSVNSPNFKSSGESGVFQQRASVEAKRPTNGLASLMSNYESSDSEPEEIPILKESSSSMDITNQHSLCVDSGTLSQSLSENPMSGGGQSETPVCLDSFSPEIFSESTTVDNVHTADLPIQTPAPSQKRQPIRNSANFPAHRRQLLIRKPRSLYEKLVAQDIERDNNTLLQCMIHICNKKFLEYPDNL